MTERTNRTIAARLSKYFSDHQNDLSCCLELVMMANRLSNHTVTKYSLMYLVLGIPLRLPIDCMHETRHKELFPTPSDYVYNLRKKLENIASSCEIRDGC